MEKGNEMRAFGFEACLHILLFFFFFVSISVCKIPCWPFDVAGEGNTSRI